MIKEFHGGYIVASEEAYQLLTHSGYGGSIFSLDIIKYISVYGQDLSFHEKRISLPLEFAEFYINDGELSWDKPIVQICDNPDVINANQLDATISLNNLPLSPMAELKEKWISGKYEIYVINLNLNNAKWRISDGDLWEDIEKLRHVAILKEHSHIADAVINNPDLEVYQTDGAMLVDFFEEYDANVDYRVSRGGETFLFSKDVDALLKKNSPAIAKTIDTNDGGKNNFYTFAPYVKDVDSLSRYLELGFAEGNILKSLTSNLGARHVGTDSKREAKKCLHYAVERMLYTFSSEEILSQVEKQLKGN